jgi:hypothetical protein
MNPDDYRERARHCREAAARASEPVKDDFLAAAATWEQLAGQVERLRAASTAQDPSAGEQDPGAHLAPLS